MSFSSGAPPPWKHCFQTSKVVVLKGGSNRKTSILGAHYKKRHPYVGWISGSGPFSFVSPLKGGSFVEPAKKEQLLKGTSGDLYDICGRRLFDISLSETEAHSKACLPFANLGAFFSTMNSNGWSSFRPSPWLAVACSVIEYKSACFECKLYIYIYISTN